jgi:uncharacterized protein
MIVVSDTSVITSLIHISRLVLLRDLYGQVLIPQAVGDELARTHQALPPFLEVRPALNRHAVDELTVELDLGEAEAIVLAKEIHADLLLIDEKLGRRVAMRQGLAITGLVGILLEGKDRRLIGSVREVVSQLEERAGFFISEAVKREAFQLARE